MKVLVLVLDSEITEPKVFWSIQALVEYHEENDVELEEEDIAKLQADQDVVDASSAIIWVELLGYIHPANH